LLLLCGLQLIAAFMLPSAPHGAVACQLSTPAIESASRPAPPHLPSPAHLSPSMDRSCGMRLLLLLHVRHRVL
jgi:hypothetical protein